MSDIADLADLILSELQEHSQVSGPSPELWSYRRPILLPLSPIPGNPASNKLSPPLFPCHRFGLGVTKSGDIYIYGGWKPEHTDIVYHYSAKDNTVTVLQCSGDNPGARYDHAMTMVGSSVLALHGGIAAIGNRGRKIDDSSLFLFNLVSRKWLKISTAGKAPGPRQHHSVAIIGTTIFIFGGEEDSRGNELWAFDLKTIHSRPKWELITPSSTEKPPPRNTSVLVPYQNKLMVFV
ncbi:Kelch repeat-containing protein 1 [Leucoagaricus sp. SymC.cos]|nr:Kelch repeat-containing protein 1 [Leucoagaricus sp. SymC.cos]